MDLAKVAAKAIHNLQGVQNTNQFWSEEAVKKLDEFTQTFGEELDEIMVSRSLPHTYYQFKRTSLTLVINCLGRGDR